MIKKLFSLLFILLILAFAVFCFTPNFYVPDNPLPKKIAEAKYIIIDDEMAMEKTNGIWNSPENESYPLDNNIITQMLENIKQASVYAKKHKSSDKGNFKIVLQNDKNEKTELYFHKKDTKISGAIAIINKQSYYFPADLQIPSQPYQWFSQPLFPFDDASITKISGTEKENFSFANLLFLQATRQNDFSDWDNKQIEVTLSDGIILKITIFTRNGSYWLTSQIKGTIMPTKEAKEYINDNKDLYENWFFEIPQPIGNKLF